MLIYVAGPYSAKSPEQIEDNVRRAIDLGEELLKFGVVPFIPHLTHFWDKYSSKTHDEWLTIDLVVLEKCDGLIRLPGNSVGADIEVEFCRQKEIPFFILPNIELDTIKTATKILIRQSYNWRGRNYAYDQSNFEMQMRQIRSLLCESCLQDIDGLQTLWGKQRVEKQRSDAEEAIRQERHNQELMDKDDG
jgi:hypothetical protein